MTNKSASNLYPSTILANKVALLFINLSRYYNPKTNSWRNWLILVLSFLVVTGSQGAIKSSAFAQTVGTSGLPLPRFVSLKSKRVNMRIGPGRDYQVQWLYIRKNLPMEIIQEFGNWRKVRDPNGVEGWILHSLLSGARAAIVTPWDMSNKENLAQKTQLPTINMYDSNSKNADIIARLEAGSLAKIKNCQDDWCRLLVAIDKDTQISGYVPQTMLWGVYPDEKIKN
jgi:SH3-like domain-containing protein